MKELLKDIIDNIKKWNIKRKSDDVLCPYCLHNYHKIIKWIGIHPIYTCNQCHVLFNCEGKELKTPIFIENAPEDFTMIYREKDIKITPFPELSKEEEQSIKKFIEKYKKRKKEMSKKIEIHYYIDTDNFNISEKGSKIPYIKLKQLGNIIKKKIDKFLEDI